MRNSLSLDALLRQILDQELSARGLEPARADRDAAGREFSRALGRGTSGALPSDVLESSLARALQLAAGVEAVEPHTDAGPAHALAPVLALGAVLDDKYEIEALLAEGGFGQVYRARDRDLDCAVAIKVLKAEGEGAREKLLELQQEARRLTRLRHPNIVEWKTLNRTADGRHYLVMEFLEGELLEDVLRREQRLAPARAARILFELCDALAHAHALPDGACLLHLDLKPTNVFLVHDRPGAERVKVLDFGISRFAHAGRAEEAPVARVDFAPGATASFVTATGSVACTPRYCSPEQAAHVLGTATAPLDARSDLYSLGVLGYRMLTGRFPQESAPDLLTTLRWRATRPAAPVAAAGVPVPRRLARFVQRCLALDPAARFPDAHAAKAELQALLAPRPRALVLAAAALVGLLALLAWATLGRPAPVLPELHAVVRATGRGAAQEPLWFGPARLTLALELPDLPDLPDGAAPALQLLDGPGADAATLAGWRLEVRDERHVELVAEAGATRAASAFLTLESQRGRRTSARLELQYVAPSAWELVAADVPGRGARALDPRGQTLEVLLRGPAAALPAALQLQLGARAWTVARDEFRSDAEQTTYRIALSEVDWEAATGAPSLRVEDRAGNVLVQTLELPLVLAPLAVTSLELAGSAQAAGKWHVLVGEQVELVVLANRRARLRWTLADSEGREVDSGTAAEGALEYRLSLDSARWPARSFDGRLRVVLAEDEWVAHAPGAGAAQAELALEVRSTGAVFDVSLAGARSWIEEGRREAVHYVGGGALRAAVHRDHDVPMRVTLSVRLGDEPPVETHELAFAGPLEERKTLELALTQDGRHRLLFEGRRLGAGERPLAGADLRRELELVRDTRAPRSTLEGWEAGLVLRSAAPAAHAFRVRVEDEVHGAEPPPVTVAWSLALRQHERTFELGAGELVLAPGQPGVLPDALSDTLFAGLGDGRHVLTLQAVDFAGNQEDSQEFEWSVSTTGPRLDVLVPAPDETWTRASEAFVVELRAEDPNGVARVECELVDERAELAPHRLELQPLSTPSGPLPRWGGSFELDHRWAGRAVRLAFRAFDGNGSASPEEQIACTVGSIPSFVPAYVEVGRPGAASAPMRRVPGNPQVAYLFAGRGDSLENATFRAHGLADFSERALTSSLRRQCPPGSIADFYLDEHEVSAELVLVFLRAPDGWADPRWWVASAPPEERRLALARALAAGDPALPATGLTCAEAQAFAAWCGKELPTYLHWEYAVRGPQARPFSFAVQGATDALETRVNVESGEPWPVTAGDDRTPDTGLLGLCSNVAEWTSTPVRGALATMSLPELLEPVRALPGTRHFVVGGAFDRPAFHFGTIARRASDEGSESIGFRCMLPAARVEAAFLDQSRDLRVVPLR
jgi:serine/threonine protein kinase